LARLLLLGKARARTGALARDYEGEIRFETLAFLEKGTLQERLGLYPSTLRYRIQKHGMKAPQS
jgi:hypothetical protein